MYKRIVGSKLNLKISLSDGNPTRFVRAFLYDLDGVSLTPAYVDLVHQDKGLYSDDVAVMPNADEKWKDADVELIDSGAEPKIIPLSNMFEIQKRNCPPIIP